MYKFCSFFLKKVILASLVILIEFSSQVHSSGTCLSCACNDSSGFGDCMKACCDGTLNLFRACCSKSSAHSSEPKDAKDSGSVATFNPTLSKKPAYSGEPKDSEGSRVDAVSAPVFSPAIGNMGTVGELSHIGGAYTSGNDLDLVGLRGTGTDFTRMSIGNTGNVGKISNVTGSVSIGNKIRF